MSAAGRPAEALEITFILFLVEKISGNKVELVCESRRFTQS